MTKEELKQEAEEKYFNHEMADFQGFYNYHYYCLGYLESAEPREKRIEELEKEIAELDCQMNRNKACYSCANATERCFKNEIGCPCEKYKSYKDENAELKEQNLILADCITCHSTCKNENVEIKKQLTKAKELIKEMLSILPKENIEGIYEITEEAEQFLNGEVEKPIESSVDHIIEQNEKEVGLNPDYFSGGW